MLQLAATVQHTIKINPVDFGLEIGEGKGPEELGEEGFGEEIVVEEVWGRWGGGIERLLLLLLLLGGCRCDDLS